MSLNVRIPDSLVPKIEERASAEGKRPENWVIEVVEKQLEGSLAASLATRREQVRAMLKEAGLWSEVSPELISRYVTLRSPEELQALRERLQQISIEPPLSETIIADRGPKA